MPKAKMKVTDDSKKAVPEEIREALERIEQALVESAYANEDTTRDAVKAVEQAFNAGRHAAWTVSEDRRSTERATLPEVVAVDLGEALARHLRWWREEMAGWSQNQLAEAMNRLGVPWSRVTVAEIEKGSRRVSLDELLCLASLYSVPMVQLLVLSQTEEYRLPQGRTASSAFVNEVITGPHWKAYWDEEWWTPAYLANASPTEADWRPARRIASRLGFIGEKTMDTDERVMRLTHRYEGVDIPPASRPTSEEL